MLQQDLPAQQDEQSPAQHPGFFLQPRPEPSTQADAQGGDQEGHGGDGPGGGEDRHVQKGEGDAHGKGVDAGGQGQGQHGPPGQGSAFVPILFSDLPEQREDRFRYVPIVADIAAGVPIEQDEVIDNMMNGYLDIAVVYSGDATVILDENEDMSFFMPNEGTNIWCDAMVVPKNAENPKLAHEFINYVLTYDAAFDNSETVGYASPNAQVLEEMSTDPELYAGNEAYLPRSNYANDEMFHDNVTLQRELSKYWIRVKAEG